MHFKDLIRLLLISAASATPLTSRQDDRGSYTVAGLGSRKGAVLGAGGNTLDLAIAMLETENMGTDYVYGDGKSGDAANFGIFKQNWYMLRQCASIFRGQTPNDWNNGASLNSDLGADVAARNQCQDFYGYDGWFAGHRNGQSGIENPNTDDINRYKSAVQWIQQQIDGNPTYQSDDTRFWVDVTPI